MTRKRVETLGSLRNAAATGVSTGAWQRIEKGEEFEYSSLVRAVVALGWPGAAADQLIVGEDPETPPAEPELDMGDPDLTSIARRLDRIEEMLTRILRAREGDL